MSEHILIISEHFTCYVCFQSVLQQYQERNQPEYIHQKARETLEAQGRKFDFPPEVLKKRRVDPLDREASGLSLPELPDELRQKQVSFWRTRFFHVEQVHLSSTCVFK